MNEKHLTPHLTALADHPGMRTGEIAEVMELGRRYGFGAMMQLASACWEEWLAERGMPAGSSHRTGPCLALTVPCVCVGTPPIEGGCDWCCGAGWLTNDVRRLIERSFASSPTLGCVKG